jgi:hypothetical protein
VVLDKARAPRIQAKSLLPIFELELSVEHPVSTSSAFSAFMTLWSKGFDQEEFWEFFVQCALCHQVMPKDCFYGIHSPVGCRTLSAAIPHTADADDGTESVDGDTEIAEVDELLSSETSSE